MHRVVELLHQGDWACAYRDPQKLARACRLLAPLLGDGEAQRALVEAADSAEGDFEGARRVWSEIATALRRRVPGTSWPLDHGSGS